MLFSEILLIFAHKVYLSKMGILYDDNRWQSAAQYLSQKKLKTV